MEFPPFEHLHYYERVLGIRRNISYSNIRPFSLREFRRRLPNDLDLNWAFRNGSPELRKLIARRHRVAEDHVLVTTGATEGNFLVNATLVRPRDRVIVDIPTYSPLRDVPKGVGAEVAEIARDCQDGWRLDLDRVRKAAGRRTRLLVFANLNNPTSSALSRSEMRELADIAEECDGHILVDETFREFAFDHTPPSVAEFGPRMIALSTVTKVCGLGTLRLGWIVAVPDLLTKFGVLKDYTTGGGSAVSQTIGTWALEKWEFFLRRAKRIVEANRRIAADELARIPGLEIDVPPRGIVLFPHSPVGVGKLARGLLEEHGTVIAEGRFFGIPDHFRIGLGGAGEDLRVGLRHLRKTVASLS